jgi:hypothetical protein
MNMARAALHLEGKATVKLGSFLGLLDGLGMHNREIAPNSKLQTPNSKLQTSFSPCISRIWCYPIDPDLLEPDFAVSFPKILLRRAGKLL